MGFPRGLDRRVGDGGGVKRRDVWQSGAPLGEGGTYAMVMPITKFAEYDLEPRARRVLGDQAGRAYQGRCSAETSTCVLGQPAALQLIARATPHIASQRRELLRFVPDLSFQVTSATQAR